MEEQLRFNFERLGELDDDIVKRYHEIEDIDKDVKYVGGNVDMFYNIYKIGLIGIGSYMTYRLLGGESPTFSGEDGLNQLNLMIKFISPIATLYGLVGGIYCSKNLKKLTDIRSESLNQLDAIFDEEEKLMRRTGKSVPQ